MNPGRGLVSLGVGLGAAAAGAVLGLAAERVAVGKPLLGRAAGSTGPVPFGSVRSAPLVVQSDDGTALHVEVDEPDEPDRDGLTMVFSHGYALNLDSWHFQRLALRGRYRMVFWDQRGHGRSQRGPVGSATIDQVGTDLASVIAATASEGPLVLVGHSMGGMTLMSLAAADPQLFEERVAGVALVSTSAGGIAKNDFGLSFVGPAFQRLAPAILAFLARSPALVERGRRLGGDVEQLLVRKYSYASPVSDELVDFTARMIAATRIEVINDFFPEFTRHDKRQALSSLSGIETLVLVGDDDLLTPDSHSDEIVLRIPQAEEIIVPDAGHLVMLEHPGLVTSHLVELLDRARRSIEAGRGPASRQGGGRRPATGSQTSSVPPRAAS